MMKVNKLNISKDFTKVNYYKATTHPHEKELARRAGSFVAGRDVEMGQRRGLGKNAVAKLLEKMI